MPEAFAIERDGRTITIASSRARQPRSRPMGREQLEQSRNGRQMRTTATLSGDRLVVSTEGDRSVDHQVTFEPINNGRSLRVTRRITDVVRSAAPGPRVERRGDLPTLRPERV